MYGTSSGGAAERTSEYEATSKHNATKAAEIPFVLVNSLHLLKGLYGLVVFIEDLEAREEKGDKEDNQYTNKQSHDTPPFNPPIPPLKKGGA